MRTTIRFHYDSLGSFVLLFELLCKKVCVFSNLSNLLWPVSDLVGNPEDRFYHYAAQFK